MALTWAPTQDVRDAQHRRVEIMSLVVRRRYHPVPHLTAHTLTKILLICIMEPNVFLSRSDEMCNAMRSLEQIPGNPFEPFGHPPDLGVWTPGKGSLHHWTNLNLAIHKCWVFLRITQAHNTCYHISYCSFLLINMYMFLYQSKSHDCVHLKGWLQGPTIQMRPCESMRPYCIILYAHRCATHNDTRAAYMTKWHE